MTTVQRVLPIAMIFLAMAGVWICAVDHHFIPCRQDCGEAFDALQYVDNYRLYGFKYGLVQDLSTSDDLHAHPYFYTHNMNLAGILFALVDAVGVDPFWSKQLATIAAFGAGLLYVYRATAYHTRSWVAGIVVLALFTTDVQHVLSFGLNPLRAWHWLALFGMLFHVGRLLREPNHSPRLDRVAIVVLACVSFMFGRDFWVTIAGLSALLLILARTRRVFTVGTVVGMIGLVAAFVTPFILRQIQIALILSPSFWAMDLGYSAAIKISVLSRLISVPPVAELDAMYEALGVNRPPASPSASIASIVLTFNEMVNFLVLPSYGTLAVTLLVTVSLLALAVLGGLLWCRPRTSAQILACCGLVGVRRAGMVGAARMTVALVVAIVAGLAFFSPLSLHICLKHEFPLVAGPILLVKGLVLAAAFAVFQSARRRRSLSEYVALGVAGLLIVDHVLVQADDVRARGSMSLSWIPAVTERHTGTFAVSWVPGAVSVFTDTWAVGVPPGKERDIAECVAAGGPLFSMEDYFLFGERDRLINAAIYSRPDYWLYFRTDQMDPFTSPQPACRKDYLAQTLAWVAGDEPEIKLIQRLYADPLQAGPGGLVTFGELIEPNLRPLGAAQLLGDGEPVGTLNYNCQQGVVLGEFRIPPNTISGVERFLARLVLPEVGAVGVGEVDVVVSSKPYPGSTRFPNARPPQPNIDQMIRLFPGLPIAVRGEDYVIFDLRPYSGRN